MGEDETAVTAEAAKVFLGEKEELIYSDLTSSMKAAILLVSIGSEPAGEIFKLLNNKDMELVVQEIARLGPFSNSLKKQVFIEFNTLVRAQEYINIGGVEYARALLERTLGPIKASEIINKIIFSKRRPFDSIKKADESQIYSFLQNELSQTIAVVLSYIDPKKAANILAMLTNEKQADVAKRIATMGHISPEMIRDVERVMERKMSALAGNDILVAGGIDSAVEILNITERSVEKNIMESIEETDPELSEEIRKKMFVFEDIILLDDVSIQRVIHEIDVAELAKAIKGTAKRISDKIFANMSRRAGEMIKEEIEYMGPVRLKEVEEVQQKIVSIIRKLEEQGEIVISRGEQEVFV